MRCSEYLRPERFELGGVTRLTFLRRCLPRITPTELVPSIFAFQVAAAELKVKPNPVLEVDGLARAS
jgi:hypothetical protein